MIIGISATVSGKQSGKSTFASLCSSELKERGLPVRIIHFATPLKEACKTLFGVPEAEETKEHPSGWNWPEDNDMGKSGPMTNREIWQFFGTNIMRNHWHNDIWVMITEKYIESVKAQEADTIFLIPDVRFPNEVNHMDMLVDIYRQSAMDANTAKLAGAKPHASEESGKLIPAEKFTLKVDNSFTISSLQKEAFDFVQNKLVPAYSNKRISA